MRQINNYINEKLIIDKNIDNTERLVINLCNRLVENDNMVDDEFKKQLSAWIFKNKVKDLDRDIFYTISNEDKILDTIKDTSYIKSASKLNTVSDIINNKILIVGGGSKIQGLENFLNKHLQYPFEISKRRHTF